MPQALLVGLPRCRCRWPRRSPWRCMDWGRCWWPWTGNCAAWGWPGALLAVVVTVALELLVGGAAGVPPPVGLIRCPRCAG
ncbi:hypothetical protein NIES30_17355 [Phormidium tenue NIES-30]|uniref:Uncharacterized protein n=1 Tax=Phormidium tenue NIES-30 TaxID=549789 RepID=A0A1U7J1T9_9CYAN|nr:hypothetical protein NIES30_17355 [Phormidium tenue NIES-30]